MCISFDEGIYLQKIQGRISLHLRKKEKLR